MANTFKICTCCKHVWESLADLIRDEQVHVIGYQPSFSDSYEGLFFFSHNDKACGTTIAIPAGHFVNLYDGPEYTVQMDSMEQCKGFCKSFYDFGECSNECSMRSIRDIIEVLKNRGPEKLLARLDEVDLQHRRCA